MQAGRAEPGFEQKLAAALALLASFGIRRGDYAPWHYCALWKLGVRIPPPHFRSFPANFAFVGLLVAGACGLMWVLEWSQRREPPFDVMVCVGAFLPVYVAARYRFTARKHRLPLWRDFRPVDESVFL